jgi:hypothetical protein
MSLSIPHTHTLYPGVPPITPRIEPKSQRSLMSKRRELIWLEGAVRDVMRGKPGSIYYNDQHFLVDHFYEMICFCCRPVCMSMCVCPNHELWPDRSSWEPDFWDTSISLCLT